jgi:hypothetical protein
MCVVLTSALSAQETKTIRVGMIGLDTSHVVAFTGELNKPDNTGDLAGVRIVAAFPGGSPDIESSWKRVQGYTEKLQAQGVKICDSIEAMLKEVDAVMLESVDGRPHLKQAIPVIEAGKPLFIDKPMAASLADAMEIFRRAKAKGVPVFSASSLRFSAGFQAVRNKTAPFGDVKRCEAWSPMNLEPHHPDLFWYGIHGVESLFTIMGPGCKQVTRVAPDKVVGIWADGREGTFVAKKGYGALVEGTKQSGEAGKYDGYKPLVVEIAKFFKTGKPPVAEEETLEILAFMEAADASKVQNGAAVTIESMMAKARQSLAEKK